MTADAYVIGNGNVDTELSSQPFGEGLEPAAHHCDLVAQSLQCAAELTGALGDFQDGLELLEDICGDAVEKTNTFL